MRVCGQYFQQPIIEFIENEIKCNPSISRGQLSRRICEKAGWRTSAGELREMSCRKALAELNRRGVISLPKIRKTYAFQKASSRAIEHLPENTTLSCTLKKLGPVEVIPVLKRHTKESLVWNALMEQYHYLGKGPLAGAQIRYLIKSEKHGFLGAMAFSSATWRLKQRDTWIGWDEKTRFNNIKKVVSNSRFLITPSIHVPNLATHVLSLAVNRLPDDWNNRYGYKPVLIETFVDAKKFTGTSYQAANWTYIGKTASRSTPFQNGKVATGPKDIYIYPCCRNWRSVLLQDQKSPLGAVIREENPRDWVEEEFGGIDIYDERLKSRLYMLARDFYAKPGVLVPEVCKGSEAKTKAAYRFFDNKQVKMQTILRSHLESTIERMQSHKVILAVQDTTTIDHTKHPETSGLGPISTHKSDATGLILHDTMAFSTEGTPLGVLHIQSWARNPEDPRKRYKRKELAIEEKESSKWIKSYRALLEIQEACPNTMLVSVGDREADIYEFFAETHNNPHGPNILIRASHGRNRKVEQGFLWDIMQETAVSGYQEIHLPRRTSRPARDARVAVHFAPVLLQPPKHNSVKVKKELPEMQAWAVYVKEVDPAADIKDPIEWMLLTTVPTNTFEEACERLQWYAKRWGIEVYHRILKSGCRIEDRRLNSADRLETCLAIDLVIAWRVFILTQQGRATPDIPCDKYFSDDEWKGLYVYRNQKPPPEKPPALQEMVRMVAALGGFLGRKNDGEPGTTTIWRGLRELAAIANAFSSFNITFFPRHGP